VMWTEGGEGGRDDARRGHERGKVHQR